MESRWDTDIDDATGQNTQSISECIPECLGGLRYDAECLGGLRYGLMTSLKFHS